MMELDDEGRTPSSFSYTYGKKVNKDDDDDDDDYMGRSVKDNDDDDYNHNNQYDDVMKSPVEEAASRAYAFLTEELSSWKETDADLNLDANTKKGTNEQNVLLERNERGALVPHTLSSSSFPSPLDLTTRPSSGTTSGLSLLSLTSSKSIRSTETYRDYHDVLCTFEYRCGSEDKAVGVDSGSGDSGGGENKGTVSAVDVQYFEGLWSLLSSSSSLLVSEGSTTTTTTRLPDNDRLRKRREFQLWKLLGRLRRCGSSFLFDHHQLSPTAFLEDLNLRPNHTPPQVLRQAVCSSPGLFRRCTILRWISEDCIFGSSSDADKKRRLLPPVRESRRRSLQQQPQQTHIFSKDVGLGMEDDDDEAEFLQALLWLYRSHRIHDAKALCHDVGQPWRIAAFFSCVPLSYLDRVLTTKDDGKDPSPEDDGDDVDSDNPWNPHYFLWKQQCRGLAAHTSNEVSKQKQSTTQKKSKTLVVESEFLSLLCGGTAAVKSYTNHKNNWEEALHGLWHASVHRWFERVWYRHSLLQRSLGSRFPPFEGGYAFHPPNNVFDDDEDNDDNDDDIFEFLATIENNDGAEGAIRSLVTSWIRGGVPEAMSCIVDFADALNKDEGNNNNNKSSKLLPALPCFLHAALYLYRRYPPSISQGEGEEDDEENVVRSLGVLIRNYVRTVLCMDPGLWTCVALYLRFLRSDDEQTEEYAQFLRDHVIPSSYCTPDLRRQLMDLCRRRLGPDTDRRVACRLLDTAFDLSSSSSFTNESITENSSTVEWILLRDDHRVDAVRYANAWVRRLLLLSTNKSGKHEGTGLSHAHWFLENRFPKESDTRRIVQKLVLEVEELDDVDVDDVLCEHEELGVYVRAHAAYSEWRVGFAGAEHSCKVLLKEEEEDPLKGAAATGTDDFEKGVALSLQIRQRRRRVMEKVDAITRTAEDAADRLSSILQYAGGWLSSSSSSSSSSLDENSLTEEPNRMEELVTLRKRGIPFTVQILHRLCDEMGRWLERMSSSLTTGEGDERNEDLLQKAREWYQRALDIVVLVAEKTSRILPDDEGEEPGIMSPEQLTEFLLSVSQTRVRLLLCEQNEVDEEDETEIME